MANYLEMAKNGEIHTPEEALEAVRENSDVLKFLPTELKTYLVCKTAVQHNGLLIQFVPESIADPDLCMIAILNNGWAYGYVPEDLRTVKMRKACCLSWLSDGYSFDRVAQMENATKMELLTWLAK